MRLSLVRSSHTRLVMLWGAVGLAGCGALDAAPPTAGTTELAAPPPGRAGYLLEVDTRRRTARVETPRPSASAAGGPSFSILEGEAIGLEVRNYSVSDIGAFSPGKVRVRFDVSVTNRLAGVALEPPLTAEGGAVVPSLMFFPLMQSAAMTTGTTAVSADGAIVVDRASHPLVEPSVDWDGDGTLARWQGFDFAGDSGCTAPAPGCSRWEALPPLGPGETSPARTVGFDIDPTVSGFRAWLLLVANLRGGVPQPPPVDPPPADTAYRGIPFGEFHLPAESFGSTFTGAYRFATPASIIAILDSARGAHARVILNLTGSRRRFTNQDGTFNLTLWKQIVDEFRGLDLRPYLADGTLEAHYIVDEPNSLGTWGGRAIAYSVIEEMARYSKSIWPGWTTVARVNPQWLRGAPFPWVYLDAAWAQYAGPLRMGQIAQFRQESVRAAQELRLGLVVGLNVLNGGDGSSGIDGPRDALAEGLYQMSAAEVREYGVVLAAEPYACGFLNWQYDPTFDARPDVQASLREVSGVATNRWNAPCRRH